jgi:hypothetical protein
MKRYNGANGYPEMIETPNGHWVTYHDHQLALLDANKSSERYWESTCKSNDNIRIEYEAQLSKQQGIIVVLSAVLFLIVGVFILNWI